MLKNKDKFQIKGYPTGNVIAKRLEFPQGILFLIIWSKIVINRFPLVIFLAYLIILKKVHDKSSELLFQDFLLRQKNN